MSREGWGHSPGGVTLANLSGQAWESRRARLEAGVTLATSHSSTGKPGATLDGLAWGPEPLAPLQRQLPSLQSPDSIPPSKAGPVVQVLEDWASPLGRGCLLLSGTAGRAAAGRRPQKEPICWSVGKEPYAGGRPPPPPSPAGGVRFTLGQRFGPSLVSPEGGQQLTIPGLNAKPAG